MEEEIRTAETKQGDAVSNEGGSSDNNSPSKRGRGRPQGSKKLKVCVTDVNLMELVSGISNGGSTQPQRGRGRPKLSDTKRTEQQGSGDIHADNSVQNQTGQGRLKGSKKQASNEDSLTEDHSVKKRGRPKKSLSQSPPEKAEPQDLPNGRSDAPKIGRGRPKGSMKRKLESLTGKEEDENSSVTPRKRGRPKGSLNKKSKLERELGSQVQIETDGSLNSLKRGGRLRKMEVNYSTESKQDTSNGVSKTPYRGRGRPRKNIAQESRGKQELVTDGSQPVKRGRGRPKGSLNKKTPAYKLHGNVSRPRTVHTAPTKGRRGRPRKEPAKRGRPRKYPLPSPEELKKPKVWKPLGRPRKYPRVDPPEGVPPPPRRSRGRPRKSESKKGAHLRKSTASPHTPSDVAPRKRGRPPSTAKSQDDAPRKRGRPKGSVNKNKARGETQPDSQLPNHSKTASDSSAIAVEYRGETGGKEVERNTKHGDDTEDMFINQDVSFEGNDLDEKNPNNYWEDEKR